MLLHRDLEITEEGMKAVGPLKMYQAISIGSLGAHSTLLFLDQLRMTG